MNKTRVYFPNLNGLRFIAALLVIIHHIEQIKAISGIDNYWNSVAFIGIIGKLGVVLFFVLSGFLITYLLLIEEYSYKRISIKNFYIRRVIRIWPLYFLIIILAFSVLPNISIFTLPGYSKDMVYENISLKLFLYAIFLPNIVLIVGGVVPYAAHTWSIGLEEQYYLLWPVFLNYFRQYRMLLMLLMVFMYSLFSTFLQTHYSDFIPHKNLISTLWSTFNINCMVIGGIYAVLLFQKSQLLKFFCNIHLFYSTIALVFVLILKGVLIPFIHYEFYSILFGIIILNFSVNKEIKLSLETSVLSYLGTVSYGIYIFHPIAIVFALFIAIKINLLTNWFLYPFSIFLSIIMAGVSYKYFESFFLKFKNKFSPILSGQNNSDS